MRDVRDLLVLRALNGALGALGWAWDEVNGYRRRFADRVAYAPEREEALDRQHPSAGARGDRIVERARAVRGDFGQTPAGEEPEGRPRPPFLHDFSKAPRMIDVEHLECEHPECEQEVNLFVEAITPFGSPLVCSLHAAELYLYGITRHEVPLEERGDVWAWVRDACRHGPTKRRERLEWLAIQRDTAKAEAADNAAAEGSGG